MSVASVLRILPNFSVVEGPHGSENPTILSESFVALTGASLTHATLRDIPNLHGDAAMAMPRWRCRDGVDGGDGVCGRMQLW